MMYEAERTELAKRVKIMFDRSNTNTGGGNISIKMSDQYLLMTPTLMSERFLCELRPEQILVVDRKTRTVAEGDGAITREINMHFGAYEANENVGCVLHAHPKESLFFATLGINMPNLTEATQALGTIKCLPYRPATTQSLADVVKKSLLELGDDAVPNAFLLNSHGVLITDYNLQKAFDKLDRMEFNASVAKEAILYEKLGIADMKSCGNDYDYEPEPKEVQTAK